MPISAVLGSSALLPAGLGFRNMLINGDMRIDQRALGTNISVTAYGYTVDRWQFNNSPNGRMTVGKNSNGINPPAGFTNYLGVKTTSAYTITASDYFYLHQVIEGYNSASLSWGTANAKPVVLSFWVNASIAGTYSGALEAASSRSYIFTYTVNASNTWEYKTIFIPGDVTGTWNTTNGAGVLVMFSVGMGSNFCGTVNSWSATDTMGAANTVSVVGTLNATWNITGVQFEQNYQATPFEQRPYGIELALCQRYYEKSNGVTQVVAGATGFGGNSYWNWTPYKVSKRLSLGYVTSDSANGVRIYNADGGANSINMWKGATGYYSNGIGFEIYTTEGFAIVTTGGQTDAGLGRYYWYANAEL